MQQSTNFIRFDFAIKKYLRNKADYVVLEGFLTSVLGHAVKVQDVTDPEGNQNASDDKFNRVDILAKFESGELAIIEVQILSEPGFTRLKDYQDCVENGCSVGANNIRPSAYIKIQYSPHKTGMDFIYRKEVHFEGVHNKEDKFSLPIFPSQYLIFPNNFDQEAKTNLEQWMNFLKKTDIPPTATAPGLKEAREKLLIDRMTPEEYQAYLAHLNSVYFRDNVARSNYLEGEMTGREEGARSKALATARKLKAKGMSVQEIADLVELGVEEVAQA
jgi:hypothetical protein